MTNAHFIDPEQFLSAQLADARPDLMRSMLYTFIKALMGAEAKSQCNAEFGQRTPERTNLRNGYRPRELDTRAGTIELAIGEAAVRDLLPTSGCWTPANGQRPGRR